MGKLDNMIKCIQAKSLLHDKRFSEALRVVKEIDISKVQSVMDLKIIGQVYMDTRHFPEARKIYLHIYEKAQSRSAMYYLIYLSIRCGLFEEAKQLYEKYQGLNHETVDGRILEYYMIKAKGADRTEQIEAIKRILDEEYLEDWAYRLAKLYHKEGMEQECIEECSKIILWFGEGIVVEKAMLLKLHYVEGIDISTPKAIGETRNLAAELQMLKELPEAPENQETEELPEAPENQEAEELPEAPENQEAEELPEVPECQEGEELQGVVDEHLAKRQEMIQTIIREAKKEKCMPHFAISGTEKEQIFNVTKDLIQELCNQRILASPRIARITAGKVNLVNLEDKRGQLEGACLLIENAHELSVASWQALYRMMKQPDANIMIGLVDSEESMQLLMKKNKRLSGLIRYELFV